MPTQARQQGFTLIEVVVAFAVFSLCVAAVYETFASAVHRSSQAAERDLAWLTAQSLLSQLREQSMPWQNDQSGLAPQGLRWQLHIEPYQTEQDLRSPWRAYAVYVRVEPSHSAAGRVQIDTVELARAPR